MSDELPRRRYDLTNRQIREAFESQAQAHIKLAERVGDLEAMSRAAYHEIWGTEGQGGILRDIEAIRKDRREEKIDRRESRVLWLMGAGLLLTGIGSIVIPLVK